MSMRAILFLGVVAMAGTAAVAAEPEPLRESSVTARQQMEQFGTCVADRSPDKATKTLLMDFRSNTYQSALRSLAKANEDCFRRRGDAMRANNLSFAGAMAERLLERDPSPLNVRIIRGSAIPADPRSPSDALAICMVRSVPDQVAQLFVTEVASEAESKVVKTLQAAVDGCSRGQRLATTVEGMRAMLATAAFRTVTSAVAERN